MGRIKITSIKRLAHELLKEHGKEFKEDFEKNKSVLSELQPIESKKVRNIIAGYITKEVRRRKSGVQRVYTARRASVEKTELRSRHRQKI